MRASFDLFLTQRLQNNNPIVTSVLSHAIILNDKLMSVILDFKDKYKYLGNTLKTDLLQI